MARPTTVPQWDSTQVNTIALVASHTTQGFSASEIPSSKELNQLFNLYYQWLNWINGNTLDQDWTFTGNVSVGGTLGVTGAVTGSSTVTGTALHFTTALEQQIPPTSSTDNPGGAPGTHFTRTLYGWTLIATGGTNKIYYEIDLPVGAVIKSYTIDLNKGDTTNTVSAGIVYDTSSSEILASSGVTSSTASGLQLLGESTPTMPAITVTTGRPYYVRIVPGGTASPSADVIGNVRVTYTL